MLNNVILVGRTASEPKMYVFDSGAKAVYLDIAVNRPFKNENNEYETDFIPVSFWHGTAEKVKEYCGKGSVIAIAGRVNTRLVDKNGVKSKLVEIIADRVNFVNLVSKNNEEEKEEE